MSEALTILGIAGSLRAGSYNRAALRAAQKLTPQGVQLASFDIDGLPGFSEEHEKQPPPKIVELKQRIRAADAVLFVTPEYNYSIPGVLKNAIDWASRPYGDNAWGGKPVAIMGASIGKLGTARAQYHLRQCFVFLNMPCVLQPEIMIANAAQEFDERGELKSNDTKKLIGQLLAALATLAQNVRRSAPNAQNG